MAETKQIARYVPGRSTPGKLADLDIIQVLDRIAEGEYPAYIADKLEVSRPALHYKLKAHPDYMMAREIGAEINLDKGLQEIFDAPDLNLARMGEIRLRRLEWRAEREFPHRWAQRNYIATQAAPDPDAGLLGSINDLLKRIASNTDPKPAVDQVAEDVDHQDIERQVERDERMDGPDTVPETLDERPDTKEIKP